MVSLPLVEIKMIYHVFRPFVYIFAYLDYCPFSVMYLFWLLVNSIPKGMSSCWRWCQRQMCLVLDSQQDSPPPLAPPFESLLLSCLYISIIILFHQPCDLTLCSGPRLHKRSYMVSQELAWCFIQSTLVIWKTSLAASKALSRTDAVIKKPVPIMPRFLYL